MSIRHPASHITHHAAISLLAVWGLLSLITAFSLMAPKASLSAPFDSPSEKVADVNDRERINMEEMKIEGNRSKPNIMYVIPRADLKIEIELNDEYFLPRPPDLNDGVMIQPAENNVVSPLDVVTPLKEPIPSPSNLKYDSSIKSRSLFSTNKPEIKEGSCVGCHYPEMVISKSFSAPLLVKELNQICLHCHISRYYHICWKEAEKVIFQPFGQDKDNCRKCHAPWMQPQGVQPQGIEIQSKKTKPPWHWKQPQENQSKPTQTRWHWKQPQGNQAQERQQQESQAQGNQVQENQPQIQSKGKEPPGNGFSRQGYDIDTFCITCHKHGER